MNTQYNIEPLKIDITAGRKHYNSHKKTSLFGSETPREEKTRNYDHRYTNPRNIISPSDGRIVYEKDMEKSENSENSRLSNVIPPARTRLQYEYEKQLDEQKKITEDKNEEKTYPGFGSGFGAGNPTKDRFSRTKSEDKIQVNNQTNNTFNALGLRNVDPEEKNPEVHYKNYEDAKAYADFLEAEIRRLKMQNKDEMGKMTDFNGNKPTNFYNESQERNGQNGQYRQMDYSKYDQEQFEDREVEDEGNYLQKEAEFRARHRELERLRQANQLERERIMQHQEQRDQSDQPDLIRQDEELFRQRPNEYENQQEKQRLKSSATKNDYRQYTEEELQNCRRNPINPSLNKRTSLGGSVESEFDRSRFPSDNGHHDYNASSGMKRMSRNSSGYRTHANIFPEEMQHQINNGNLQNYKMNAPFATE